MFNFGYQLSDILWFVQLDETTEEDSYYRAGFVAGDFYMRFFYRTLTDLDVIY